MRLQPSFFLALTQPIRFGSSGLPLPRVQTHHEEAPDTGDMFTSAKPKINSWPSYRKELVSPSSSLTPDNLFRQDLVNIMLESLKSDHVKSLKPSDVDRFRKNLLGKPNIMQVALDSEHYDLDLLKAKFQNCISSTIYSHSKVSQNKKIALEQLLRDFPDTYKALLGLDKYNALIKHGEEHDYEETEVSSDILSHSTR